MVRRYEGELGVFDYYDEMFEVRDFNGEESLHFIGKDYVELPKGCINTRHMFSECKLPEGFTLGDKFDTSKVGYMDSMFDDSILPTYCNCTNNSDPEEIVKELGKKYNQNIVSIINMLCDAFNITDTSESNFKKVSDGLIIYCSNKESKDYAINTLLKGGISKEKVKTKGNDIKVLM